MNDFWRKQFEKFASRKEAAARTADIPGFQTVVDLTPQFGLVQVAREWSRDLYDGPFYFTPSNDLLLPAVNLVFVQSKNGNTGADNPGELGGGETDKHFIYEGMSRVYVDAVLAGANTIRGSGMILSVWHPEVVAHRLDLGLARHPAQVIVTDRGEIDAERELMFNVPDAQVYVLTSDAGAGRLARAVASRPWVKVISLGERLDLRRGLLQLREWGVETVSAIGGRNLATTLIDAGLVHDLYLTTSPIEAGEPNTPFYLGTDMPITRLVLKKLGQGPEAGVVFEHRVF